jgi:hypothetical protein
MSNPSNTPPPPAPFNFINYGTANFVAGSQFNTNVNVRRFEMTVVIYEARKDSGGLKDKARRVCKKIGRYVPLSSIYFLSADSCCLRRFLGRVARKGRTAPA